jgi:hypothetical protein
VLARDAALSVGIRKATDTPGAFGRARVVSAGAGLSGPLAPLERMAQALKQFPEPLKLFQSTLPMSGLTLQP